MHFVAGASIGHYITSFRFAGVLDIFFPIRPVRASLAANASVKAKSKNKNNKFIVGLVVYLSKRGQHDSKKEQQLGVHHSHHRKPQEPHWISLHTSTWCHGMINCFSEEIWQNRLHDFHVEDGGCWGSTMTVLWDAPGPLEAHTGKNNRKTLIMPINSYIQRKSSPDFFGGKLELKWSLIGTRWHLTSSNDKVYVRRIVLCIFI